MFPKELLYYPVYLEDARIIVMTSFFSHKTVSHLDLQISQRALYYRKAFAGNHFLLQKGFFCTEESFRNNVVPERRLLYTLNLDLPDGREYSYLRNGSAPRSLPENYRGLFVAVKDEHFLKGALANLIEPALEKTDCKFKLLKWMADFRPLELISLPLAAESACAMSLYRECVDSEFAMTFFRKFFKYYAFSHTAELKVMEYLLYHARLCDFDMRSKVSCRTNLTDYCIMLCSFRLVHSILKYEVTAYYTEISYEKYKKNMIHHIIRRENEEEEMSRPENQMSKLRLYRILQIIHIFQRQDILDLYHGVFHPPDAAEALRLVWSSIPDCFVSLQEMKDAYEHVFSAQGIGRAHSFYEKMIGQTVSCREPRSLSQYCRSVVRKSLYDSKQWLPDGIRQLKIPPRFESFLNLQRDNLRPENFQAP